MTAPNIDNPRQVAMNKIAMNFHQAETLQAAGEVTEAQRCIARAVHTCETYLDSIQPQEVTLQSSVADLGIGDRLFNSLANEKIELICHLEDWPPHELVEHVHNIGWDSVGKLRERIAAHGLAVKYWNPIQEQP